MATSAYVVPVVDSTTVFKDDLFKGKVLFCTGGGSGICKDMTRAMVRMIELAPESVDSNQRTDAARGRRSDNRQEVSGDTFRLRLGP